MSLSRQPVKVRGAIVGFGAVVTQGHLPGWRTRPDLAIAAVCDPIAERRHEALRLIEGVRVYEELELMLAGENLDFLDIATPPAHHAQAARLGLKAGAHVLVEKPLCLALQEFDNLAALARSNGLVLMCVHNWKHAPAYRLAHELISGGRLGRVRYVALDRMRTGPAGGSGWRTEAAAGGGILIDHAWHLSYLMRHLMGGDDPLAVSAYLGSSRGAAIEDTADLRVIFAEGRLARSHLSWCAPARRTSALVYGEAAMLEVEGERVTLTERGGAVHDLSVSKEADDSYHPAWFAHVAAEFEQALIEGPDSIRAADNLAEARGALGLILAARESAAKGGAQVRLPL